LPGGRSDRLVVAVRFLPGAVGAERRGRLVRGLFVPSTGVAGRSVMSEQRLPGRQEKPFDVGKGEVARAWEKVRAAKGAPGADGVTVAEFGAGREDSLYRVWNRMASGTYFPPPVRAVEIPKADGGTRMLGVPTVADRVAQTVAAARIGVVAEPLFHDDSYGYRRDRGALDAVGACRRRCWERDWVVDLDVRRFFDSVPWDLVLKAVEAQDVPRWVLLYVKRWLAAPVVMPDGSLRQREAGTPQGSAVSPVLANLFMHYAFDAWMAREFPDCPFERYADDAVVHCRSLEAAREVRAALEERMSQVGLELHPEKTRIVYCKDGNRRGPWDGPSSFDFLGFTFRARSVKGRHGRFTGFGPAISDRARARISAEVSGWRLHRHVSLTDRELAAMVTPRIRGWMNYYGRFYRSGLYPLLARVNYHLQKWLRRKYRRLRPVKAMRAAWDRVTAQCPWLFPHWRWVTWAWQ
jgi:RNA-directed DNA polymerase